MLGKPSILSIFSNCFSKVNTTRTLKLDSLFSLMIDNTHLHDLTSIQMMLK